MRMETVSRTVRFKKEEADLIDRFLAENPIFDFSTLSRVALLRFIKDPKLELRALDVTPSARQDQQQSVRQEF
jgi:hypothetical protein